MKNLILIFILLFIFSCHKTDKKNEFMYYCSDLDQIDSFDKLNLDKYCECSYEQILTLENKSNRYDLNVIREKIEANCKNYLIH
tara:strand:- start:255 stop:506 length:252 start_codon:yes stop_codon:yes gene_type:complete